MLSFKSSPFGKEEKHFVLDALYCKNISLLTCVMDTTEMEFIIKYVPKN